MNVVVEFDNSANGRIDRALYVHTNGAELYVEEFGSEHAPVLYYLHSGPGYNSHSFKAMMGEYLTDYRVVYADQRGGGRSVGEGGEQPDVLAQDIGAVLSALNIAKAALVMHGFGALPGVRFATEQPSRVTHLIMINPWVSLPVLAADLYRAALRTAGQHVPAELPPGDASLVDEAFALVNPKQLLDTMQFPVPQSRLHLEHIDAGSVIVNDQTEDLDMYWDTDVSANVAAFTGPVVVLAGQYDQTSYPNQVQLVLEAQPAALVAFLAAGHYPFVDEPAELADVIRQAVAVGN